MGRALAILAGALVLALVAGGLTEATLAIGHQGTISNDVLLQPALHKTTTASPTPSATPKSTPTPTTTPAPPTPAPTATPGPTATTNSFVHLRASASTSSDILDNLDGGTVVQLLSYSDPEWQEVQYNGITGYIFKTYLSY